MISLCLLFYAIYFAGFVFPPYFKECGLTEELLEIVFNQVFEGKEPTWHYKGIPEIKFYKELHHFLKRWSISQRTTKQTIGRFYMAIDPNFKRMRADNAYRLIERLRVCVESTIMSYHRKVYTDLAASTKQIMQAEASTHVTVMHTEPKSSAEQTEALTLECVQLKKQYKKSQRELTWVRKALQDISNEKIKIQKLCSAAKADAKEARLHYAVLENTFTELQD